MSDNLNEVGELGMLRTLGPILQAHTQGLPLGTGDDVAVTNAPTTARQVWTIDTMVENNHFRWYDHPLMTGEALGRKLVASNVSDLASKGALPRYALISLAVPPMESMNRIENFYKGLDEALRLYGVRLLGGDTVSAPEWTVTLALVGELDPKATIAARKNAHPGQTLYITGIPGESAAGLQILEGNLTLPEKHATVLVKRYLMPEPRPAVGMSIVGPIKDRAMIVLSDGLARDAARLGEAGNCAIVLEENRFPFSDSLVAAADAAGVKVSDFALHGGEDYELLIATVADEFVLHNAMREYDESVRISRIGRVEKGEGIWLERSGGRREPIEFRGFEHFG